MKSVGFSRLCLILVSSFLASTSLADAVPAGLVQLGTNGSFSPYAFVVDKQSRKLSIWKQEADQLQKLAEVPSDIGRKAGNKSHLGDSRTPESIYFLEKQLEGPDLPFEKYGKRAFTLNYPNLFDMREGKTGHGIWLHAIPDTETLERGSRGCVVVRNETILEISKYIRLGQTPILIFDAVKWVPVGERKFAKERAEAWMARWIQAWKSKNLESYLAFYAADFTANGMNKAGWKSFKSSLASKYSSIEVELMNPFILEHGRYAIVRALQRYKSDLHQDFGEKTLHLRRDETGEFKIISEEWKALSEPSQETLARCCTDTPKG